MRLQRYRPTLLAAGLAGILVVAGLVGSGQMPMHNAAQHDDKTHLKMHEDQGKNADNPRPLPRAAESGAGPGATALPSEAPCPDNLHISSSGPDSRINYHCKSTITSDNSETTSVSVFDSSTQTSSDGSNVNSSSVNISVTDN